MGVILDSCIWVALAAKTLDLQTVIELAGDAPVFISVIFVGRTRIRRASLHGSRRGPCAQPVYNSSSGARFVRCRGRLPPRLACLRPLSSSLAGHRGLANLWIAAQAIEHGDALMTLNRADFAGLPRLRLVIPK